MLKGIRLELILLVPIIKMIKDKSIAIPVLNYVIKRYAMKTYGRVEV